MVILFHESAGGYHEKLGWTGELKDKPPQITLEETRREDAYDDDDVKGREEPVELTRHLQLVAHEAENIQKSLANLDASIPWQEIVTSAWWHDVGKAHVAFQTAMRDGEKVSTEDPDGERLWAKSGESAMPRYRIPVSGTKFLGIELETMADGLDVSESDDEQDIEDEQPTPESNEGIVADSRFDDAAGILDDAEVAPDRLSASVAMVAAKTPKDTLRRRFPSLNSPVYWHGWNIIGSQRQMNPPWMPHVNTPSIWWPI